MTPNRTVIQLAMGVLVVLLAVPAFAEDLQGFQPVAPADISPYGCGPQPHEGYFFSIDELYWSISAPRVRKLGGDGVRTVVPFMDALALPDPGTIGMTDFDPQFAQQVSTQDTSRLTSKFKGGERIEFGRLEDGRGWIVSLFLLRDQNQQFDVATSDMFLNDPTTAIGVSGPHELLYGRVHGNPGRVITDITGTPPRNVYGAADFLGPLPVTFDSLHVENRTKLWNVEMSYLRRLKPLHHGGNFEWYLGAGYMEFDDEFHVHGVGGVLDESDWVSQVQNHIVGPQIGARYFKQVSRLIISTEARFLAGYNRQNISLDGQFGTNIVVGAEDTNVGHVNPEAWVGGTFNSRESLDKFSGVGELRADLRYVLTRNLDIRVGWTGMWMGNIGRANGAIFYQVPEMLIDTSRHSQDVFIHGINVGVDVNR